MTIRRSPTNQGDLFDDPAECDFLDRLPDVRDGLTRRERVVLWVLHETQKERRGRSVPMVMLYGRVVEKLDMSMQELQAIVARLGGMNE